MCLGRVALFRGLAPFVIVGLRGQGARPRRVDERRDTDANRSARYPVPGDLVPGPSSRVVSRLPLLAANQFATLTPAEAAVLFSNFLPVVLWYRYMLPNLDEDQYSPTGNPRS